MLNIVMELVSFGGTAVQQSAALNDSYRIGFQDGVKKERDRINILVEHLPDYLRKADQ